MFKKLLLLKAMPAKTDAGLLALRLFVGVPLLLHHGLEKLFGFSRMAAHFPNPLHIGVVPSLLFATLSDGICSVLLVLGLATRWAALVVFINIFVVFAVAHHFSFFGRGGAEGEMLVLYLGAMIALFLAGAGKYSIDGAMKMK